MEFILGVFTGAALMMLLGVYLNERDKKKGVPKHRNPPPPPKPFAFDINPPNPATPEQRLWDAVLREDFEEAARMRDLMNKK